jgi:hypothetical protein
MYSDSEIVYKNKKIEKLFNNYKKSIIVKE